MEVLDFCGPFEVFSAARLNEERRREEPSPFEVMTVEYDKHVVEGGWIVTSAGISAGIDMALKVVERYYGNDIARATARHMEYPYPDNNARRIKF